MKTGGPAKFGQVFKRYVCGGEVQGSPFPVERVSGMDTIMGAKGLLHSEGG